MCKLISWRWLVLALALASTLGSALAADRATPREARILFERAVEYMETHGPEQAFAAFNDRRGDFVRKDLYVFVIDEAGVYHASGAAPEVLVGLNVLNTTDSAGNPLFREMIRVARERQEGTVRYMWLNRVTNQVEPKVSYIRKIDRYILGVGYSAPRSDADDAKALLDRAVALVQEMGTQDAALAFNNRRGDFIQGDLYVFMIDLDSGRFQAMGLNPGLTDTDALGLRDSQGNALVEEMFEKLQEADSATVEYAWLNPITNRVEPKRSYVQRVNGSLVGVGHYLDEQPPAE